MERRVDTRSCRVVEDCKILCMWLGSLYEEVNEPRNLRHSRLEVSQDVRPMKQVRVKRSVQDKEMTVLVGLCPFSHWD
jgi:hypothetical protein